MTRHGKDIRFEGPFKEGASLNFPKGPTVLEVQQALCRALKEKRPNEKFTRREVVLFS